MRILIAHVRYRQRGGEDVVVDTEAALLRDAGHDVAVVDPSSEAFDELQLVTKLQIGLGAGDHHFGRTLVREAILAHAPDVVHFHNLYPLLGSGAIAEAAQLGCGTVQTVHNYRLGCIAGTHFRDGGVCESCRPLSHLAGVARGCYRSSRLASAAMARGVAAQWRQAVGVRLPDVLLCLTRFMMDRLIAAGLPREMVLLKPNGVVGPAATRREHSQRSGAVFVGRLSPEKGIQELLDGWSSDAPALKVVGVGPLEAPVRRYANGETGVTYVGTMCADDVRREIGSARVLIMPSRCFEGLPLVALEALSEGTPVTAFALGAGQMLREVDGCLLAAAEDFEQLRRISKRICTMGESDWTELSEKCTSVYERQYTPVRSLEGLESAYARAAEHASARLRR